MAATATVKLLLVGYDIDEEYAAAMSYRMVQGQFPLLDLWEPHQTSGFLAALLMIPFLAVTGSTQGVILYLRVCGLCIHGLITYLLYRNFVKRVEKTTAALLSFVYFFSLPKLFFFPDFSNLQIWSLTLMLLYMSTYYEHKKENVIRLRYLIGAGFFLALEVLTYPSTILVFPVALFCMIRYRQSNVSVTKELSAFVAPCLCSALLFIGRLLTRMSASELFELLPIVASDGSHSHSLSEWAISNARSLGEICILLACYALAATLLYVCIRGRKVPEKTSSLWFCLLLLCTFAGQIGIWIFADKYPNYPLLEYFIFPCIWGYYILHDQIPVTKDRTLSIVLPLSAFAGIVLFTNHPLLVSAPFLGLLATESLRLLYQHKKFLSRGILYAWILVLLFGKCYLVRTTGGEHYPVTYSLSRMQSGPASGLIADSPTVRRYRQNHDLIQEKIPAGSKIFYAGIHNDIYLMQDVQICTPSTISSPTLDDKINQYFDKHPQLIPEYVICDQYVDNGSEWLADFLDKNCEPDPIGFDDYIVIFRSRSTVSFK